MTNGTLLYIGGFELPDKNAAALRVVANAKLLRALGFRVILVGVRNAQDLGLKRSDSDVEGFECWSVPYPKSIVDWCKYIVGSNEIAELVRAAKPELAGIICYNYPAAAQLRLFRLCRLLGGRCIADVTEWYDSSGGSAVFRAIKSLDTAARMRYANLKADGLITTSNWMTQHYSVVGIPIVELPSLFDVDSLPKVEKVPRESKSFVYVGSPFVSGRVNLNRSNLKDRLDLCIVLFHSLHVEKFNFLFSIYGVTESEYLAVFPEHETLLRTLKDKVLFHGRISNCIARARVAEADFSIFFRDPTRVTLAGFPTKLAESVSLGTPVITNLHANLRPFSHLPYLFLATPGTEIKVMLAALTATDADVREIQRECARSREFDYRTFLSPVRGFTSAVWGERHAAN